jgi:hypothetical protein
LYASLPYFNPPPRSRGREYFSNTRLIAIGPRSQDEAGMVSRGREFAGEKVRSLLGCYRTWYKIRKNEEIHPEACNNG